MNKASFEKNSKAIECEICKILSGVRKKTYKAVENQIS